MDSFDNIDLYNNAYLSLDVKFPILTSMKFSEKETFENQKNHELSFNFVQDDEVNDNLSIAISSGSIAFPFAREGKYF